MIPRGVRNNNPGNIRWGDDWQGLVAPALRTDPEFCQFIASQWGIRAISDILKNYAQDGILTLREAINRWAPPTENDTQSYVNAVSASTSIQPDAHIDLSTHEAQFPLIKAIIYHENGMQPYSDDMINLGMKLAAVEDQT
jgi:hypothetical protein